MSKVILYSHGGSGNHGCEAIVRGTYKLLHGNVDELYSYRKDEDIKFELDKLLDVKEHTKEYPKYSLKRILASLKVRLFHNEEYAEKIIYDPLFENVEKGDIALSIGGDNYCYNSFGELALCNKYLNKKGVRTVLWGCSVEPTKINEKMKSDLLNYSLIVTRETITYKALKKFHQNVVLCPDPAFNMDIQEVKLPDGWKNSKTIGINLSPVVIDYSNKTDIVLKNYEALVDYIINYTDYNIALIPHVTWSFTDDRSVLNYLYEKFKLSNRILFVKENNAMSLKYIISQCCMFIGARTHSTIAAYSTCVPTLVLGYSIKAKGIAKDIFGNYENYVLPTQELSSNDDLINAFKWMDSNKDQIKSYLNSSIDGYIVKHKTIFKEIEKLKVR